MKNKSPHIVLILMMLFVLPGTIYGQILTLREELETEKTVIRLSDVVLEQLDESSDPVLADSPPWGSVKTLSRNFILSRTRSAGIELRGPVQIEIRRLMLERSEEVRSRLEKRVVKLLEESKWKDSGGDLRLEFRNFPLSLRLPPGGFSLECRIPSSISGIQVVSFTIAFPEGYRRRFSATCRFHLIKECAVAARDIKRGETVGDIDLEWRETDLAECYHMPVTQRRDICGMRVDRYVRKGDLISLKSVERIPDVAKGQSVLVQVARGMMLVSVKGTSLEDGWLGDRILVRNKASGKIDKYCVIDRGKVSPVTPENDKGAGK